MPHAMVLLCSLLRMSSPGVNRLPRRALRGLNIWDILAVLEQRS
jgi:hypothetical protein